MKKLLVIFFLAAFGCLTVLSQETAIFQIRKIKKIENGCYKFTRNYDLVISMAKQSEDCVVDLIMQYLTSEEQ